MHFFNKENDQENFTKISRKSKASSVFNMIMKIYSVTKAVKIIMKYSLAILVRQKSKLSSIDLFSLRKVLSTTKVK